MKSQSSARTVTVDPALAVLACIGIALAIATFCLSSPFSGPTVAEIHLGR